MSKTLRDTLERLFWTVVAAGLGSLAAGPLLGVSAWQAAGVAALSAGVNLLSILARQHLAPLPQPGEGLPGLPTEDGGYSLVGVLLVIFLVLAILILVGAWHPPS